MELREVVRRRRMVRRYTPDPVDPAVLDRMLRTAVRAPSAGFSQGWAFLVLDTPDDVACFWAATTPPERAAEPDAWLRGMRSAPVVVVPWSCEATYRRRYAERDKDPARRGAAPGQEPGAGPGAGPGAEPGAGPGAGSGPGATTLEERWSVPYWHVDTGMAALLLLQVAVDEGLGACLFGIPAARVAPLRRAFGVPDDHTPVGGVTVGHPDPTSSAGGSATTRRRRPLDDVVHRGRWGGSWGGSSRGASGGSSGGASGGSSGGS